MPVVRLSFIPFKNIQGTESYLDRRSLFHFIKERNMRLDGLDSDFLPEVRVEQAEVNTQLP